LKTAKKLPQPIKTGDFQYKNPNSSKQPINLTKKTTIQTCTINKNSTNFSKERRTKTEFEENLYPTINGNNKR
jgi:hypothetical protein